MKNTHRFRSMYKTEWVECTEAVANVFKGNPSYQVEELDKCQSCGIKDAETPHTCPYAQEICNSDTECNCCEHCIYNCAMDI